ncbi:type II toxin-antitoxin system PemK/MazF family toxin [soil metagenome]
MVDLNPTRGHEQAGLRPVVIVSVDEFNSGPASLVIVLPITATDRKIPLHVPVDSPEGGLDRRSFILPDQIRSVSKERLVRRRGRVEPATMEAVEQGLRLVQGL